ncbi:MAG: DUF4954 family protein, partial [Bacteroidota bacterium]|nr:DUF4954 family protein [Bacteroidota bacterium]
MEFLKRFDASMLGYGFIDKAYLPKGKDEYYLRLKQNPRNDFRNLTGQEVDQLVRNGNSSDCWDKVLVSDPFDASLVRGCSFFGLTRIGKLEAQCLEYHDLRLTVGLYNSMIISSDLGDNIAMHNVGYLSHYIIGNESMLFNIEEMETSYRAKFGNGMLKDGEEPESRVWLEICNENGGRKVLPFNGMLTSDAWLWAKYRDDKKLMTRLMEVTETQFTRERGYYGTIGRQCVIKNTKSIKDVSAGEATYIKGASKLKNLTINSSFESHTQIGEGVELVNGIIGYGCKIFYGVKAVRFLLGNNSSLKYGARLINSILGENSTISCCEVLHSLIYPSHEQHHNNSFLIAGTILGQSNIAAGATLGSNHNSRANDGEMLAGRGFWAGLSTSIKHNSKFATFILLTKANYKNSLNIPFPFSLVSNNEQLDRLEIIPAYWWLYNMYALERNTWKFKHRDARKVIGQPFEYGYLAPDSIGEILEGIRLLEYWTGRKINGGLGTEAEIIRIGHDYLSKNNLPELILKQSGIEDSKREVIIHKPHAAWQAYRDMIVYFAFQAFTEYQSSDDRITDLYSKLNDQCINDQWINMGGQLIPGKDMEKLKSDIKDGNLNSWNAIHQEYQKMNETYLFKKACFASYALEMIFKKRVDAGLIAKLAPQAVKTAEYVKDQT